MTERNETASPTKGREENAAFRRVDRDAPQRSRRLVPRAKCARPTCSFPASVRLEAVPPKTGAVTGEYPRAQVLCGACVVTEARVADRMGYLPVGENL